MEQRAALRFPTDVEAECRSCTRAWSSRLVNVSTTGCMISIPREELPGRALLRLRVKGLTAIDGEIVWQHRDHAGIRFNAPLHAAVIEHLAFQGTDRGYDTGPPVPLRPERAPARPAPALHGELVKRSWTAGEEAPAKAASAG